MLCLARAPALLAAALFLLGAASPARAANVESEAIALGIRQYNNFDYDAAIEQLGRALASPSLSNGDRVEGLRHLALAYVVTQRPDEARNTFKTLLGVDPAFVLPETENPRALEIFHSAQRAVAANRPPTAPSVEAVVSKPAATPAPRRQPLYKKWWLWTAVGAGAAAIGLGLGLGLGLRGHSVACLGASSSSGCAEFVPAF